MPDSGPTLPKRDLLRTMTRKANAVLAKAAKENDKFDKLEAQYLRRGKPALIKAFRRLIKLHPKTRKSLEWKARIRILANKKPDRWSDGLRMQAITAGEMAVKKQPLEVLCNMIKND